MYLLHEVRMAPLVALVHLVAIVTNPCNGTRGLLGANYISWSQNLLPQSGLDCKYITPQLFHQLSHQCSGDPSFFHHYCFSGSAAIFPSSSSEDWFVSLSSSSSFFSAVSTTVADLSDLNSGIVMSGIKPARYNYPPLYRP